MYHHLLAQYLFYCPCLLSLLLLPICSCGFQLPSGITLVQYSFATIHLCGSWAKTLYLYMLSAHHHITDILFYRCFWGPHDGPAGQSTWKTSLSAWIRSPEPMWKEKANHWKLKLRRKSWRKIRTIICIPPEKTAFQLAAGVFLTAPVYWRAQYTDHQFTFLIEFQKFFSMFSSLYTLGLVF